MTEPKYAVLPTNIETLFVVQVLRRWSSLTVLGLPIAGELGAEGCIGFMPIFKDRASAEQWKVDQGHPDAGIAEIAYAKDVPSC